MERSGGGVLTVGDTTSTVYGGVITGTGGTKESFRAIVGPFAVRKKISQIIEEYTQTYSQQQEAPGMGG